MTNVWRLDTLPSEILIIIFDYCHAFDLVRLSEVCKRFYNIVQDDTLWIKKSKLPLVTNQISKRFRDRCNPLLCLRQKWHVSRNWECGRYMERTLFWERSKLMPWIQLKQNSLWWGANVQILGYRRTEYFDAYDFFHNSMYSKDVCKFVVKDNYVISGHVDGMLEVQEIRGKGSFSSRNAHNSDINAVDATDYVILTGSNDGNVKVWPIGMHMDDISVPYGTIPIFPFSAHIPLSDRVWSLAADPTGVKFAVGLSGNKNKSPLHIFDIECYNESDVLRHCWRKGAGVLGIVWEDPNTLLTCGYDTYVRKWDLRTALCVNSWPDPTDATVYCLSSDHAYTMVTGTQYHSKAVLWDQRQKNFVQHVFFSYHVDIFCS
ncbi:F-box/WD repeat-containing protein 4 isoform X2 [Cephus cinctus]|uniref:F-box/WD repeat-containing protein 4 isoform X2 n=1 Tax=Cephus cinctus TaxID=211228 RepID=A0AAJ7RKI3_CEPCN|nr:F-box/WD repeat-containing protein 4 isoform X2 [Cephus cinctus]